MSRSQLQLGDWLVSYSTYGAGPGLILLHGGSPGTSGEVYFSRNIAQLAKKFTTYVIDFPGWGNSSKNLLPADGWANPLEMAGEVITRFIEALKLERPHLLGSSLGASAALYHAISKPGLAGKLVLVSPGGGRMSGSPYSEAVIKLITYYMGDGPNQTKFTSLNKTLTYRPDVFSADELEQRYEESCDPAVIANPPLRMPTSGLPTPLLCDDLRLANLENDVLIVWGRQDQVQPLECLESFQSIQNRDVMVMNRCGHLPNMEHPARFNSLVAEFLSRQQ